MKNLVPALLICLLLGACTSSRKHLANGNYDWAINKAVKKLRKNPKKDKQIVVLEQAYAKAVQRDREQIEFLTKEGNPDRWDEIYNLYFRLKGRQTQVRTLPLPLTTSNGRKVNFAIVNYDDELIEAKKKAAEYFYVHGTSLLEQGGKENARQAYADFMYVKKFYPEYKDLNAKLQQALSEGTSHVLFKMENRTGVPLPPSFEEELVKISLRELDGQWINYHTRPQKDLSYDYTILANIKMIDVSPEAVKEVHYAESKEVPDGFEYALDKKGNVMKDSLGNDIKIEKTKIITCNLVETQQKKAARIAGTLDFMDNSTKQIIKTNPISAENFFEHFSTRTVAGDINALKPETKKKLANAPMPFPPDFDMIYQCGITLKDMSKNIVFGHRHLFR